MIDEKDELILEELKKDSRQSTVGISKKTKIPRVTVHERIKKMKNNGTIKQFTVIPNYERLDLPTTAYVLISFNHERLLQREVAEKVAKLPHVYEVYLIAGEWDMIAKVREKNLDTLGKLVLEKMRKIEGVQKTVTLGCFETIKKS